MSGVVEMSIPGQGHQIDILNQAAILHHDGVCPEVLESIYRCGNLNEYVNAIIRRQLNVIELPARIAIDINAIWAVFPHTKTQIADEDVLIGFIDDAHRARGRSNRTEYGIQEDGVL